MASPVGHTLVGIGIAAAVAQATGTAPTPIFWIATAVASNAPDLDWIGVIAGLPIRRVHRSATHSLLVLAGLIVMIAWISGWLLGEVNLNYGIAWSLALLTHPLLDVVTTGPRDAAAGYGIPLLWPVLLRRWALRPPLFSSPNLLKVRSLSSLLRAVLPEVLHLGPVLVGFVLLGYLPWFVEIAFHRIASVFAWIPKAFGN